MPGPVFALADAHVTRTAALDPVMATYLGIPGQDARGTDYGPDGTAARADLIRATLRELAGISPADDADRHAGLHLRERLEARLAWHETGEPGRDLAAAFGVLQ